MSSTSSRVSHLLEKNQEYAKSHKPIDYFSERDPARPKPRVLIYSCVDNRVHPEVFLGLTPGEALIVRNAGSNVPRNILDLLLLDGFINQLEEIFIIEHTDCGGTHVTDEGLREGIRKYAPDATELDEVQFGTFKDPEARAREFVKVIKGHPLVRKELAAKTVGAVYDIKTGEVKVVDA